MNDSRFERKIRIPFNSGAEIIAMLKMGVPGFRTHHADRFVNSIYFDSSDFASYLGNIEGNPQRTKLRFRWYGAIPAVVPEGRLEQKKKNGLVGDKAIKLLVDVALKNKGAFLETIQAQVLDFPKVEPIFLNRYRRSYFQHPSRPIRVTLDHGVDYFPLVNTVGDWQHLQRRPLVNDPYLTLEIKYHQEEEDAVEAFLQQFPFRVTKHSKYVFGVQSIMTV